MITSIPEFDKQLESVLGIADKTTLSKTTLNRLRFGLGENLNGKERIDQALFRVKKIFQTCFSKDEVWLRITLWSDREEENLLKCGFDLSMASFLKKEKVNGYDILLVCYDRYINKLFEPLFLSIIRYEVAEEPSANITCYFVSFSQSVVINVYDDRGIDVLVTDSIIREVLYKEYKKWIALTSPLK